ALLMAGNGVTKVGDKYIYVRYNGELVVNASYWVGANDLQIAEGTYKFDADGFMINTNVLLLTMNVIVAKWQYQKWLHQMELKLR
ncbi:MAG: hypothetical protein IKW17_07685, partial [Paludibacteraceae bacterium]|nr:hypothetical protein [Paludibacteraceae bacterium]